MGVTLKKTGVLAVLVSLCLTVNGCLLLPKEEEALAPPLIEPEEVEVQTEEVTLGTIENKLSVSASFMSSKFSVLSFPISGYVSKVNVSLGDEVKKGDVLAEMDVESLKSSLRKAQIELKYAQKELNEAPDSTNAQKSVALAKETVSDLQRQIKQGQLTSGMNGKVTAVDENLSAGMAVQPFKEMVRIQEDGTLQLRFEGSDATSFRPGMAVEVTVNDQSDTGTVVTSPSNATEKEDGKPANIVIFDVEGLDYATVSEGQTASVVAVLERKEDVIVLPKNYVNTYIGRQYVYVMEDGVKVERDVKVGMETTGEYEILEGLNVGDLIVKR